MIKSMTGYGAIQTDNDQHSLTVEVKSLNSKSLDLFTKIGHIFSDKEIEVRNYIAQQLERGKISVVVNYTRKTEAEGRVKINRLLVAQYYRDLKETAELLGADSPDLLRLALAMPDAYEQANPTPASESEWQAVWEGISQATALCDAFRAKEGKALEEMLKGSIATIRSQLATIDAEDPKRMAHIREKIRQQVSELIEKNAFDENRFEQELLFYAEKLDIAEERVRLKSHLDYFLEVMDEPVSNGKKLNFIAQEMGREINTIGSKANDAALQRLVVVMKEELEKIKEQLNNVL
ncbi:YicC/YloC family endoribonuclease [Rhodoflexus caldus]|uniref:YicC/YloC family endoribonuclease n=1 Tax=Rhodoflexus caldus TaxID=2891236 RepID=UPI00202A3E8A|nr:YicC/YloC family endoribonuclease [Rhodoflexus caldus]